MDSKGYYAIFGVSEHANYQEIKKAYRHLAKKYHPDRNTSGISDEMIKMINAAFEILSDKDKRHTYDNDEYHDVVSGSAEQGSDHDVHDEKVNSRVYHNSKTYSTTGSNAQNFVGSSGFADYNDSNERSNYTQFAEFGPDSTTISGLLDIPKGRFHLVVEPSLCMAFGSCETLAPKVFVVEKNKRINPKAIVASEVDATYDEILSAAQTCPTKAIKIIDRYTGEQIYP